MNSITLSISIAVPPAVVAGFVRDPLNLPVWAPAFCRSVQQVRGEWIVQSPVGAVRLAFVPDNPYGVLDHSVRLPGGLELCNPMRVMPRGNGSEVLFTLFRQPGQSDDELECDVDQVFSDLQTLRQVLELLVANDLSSWKLLRTEAAASEPRRTELHRVFEFASFQDAMAFMQAAVPKIAVLDHHPRWENRWCSVAVWLTSWDADWQPSPADIELARYLDVLRAGFAPAPERDDEPEDTATADDLDDEDDDDYDDEEDEESFDDAA